MQRDNPQTEELEPELDSVDDAAALWSECLKEAGDDAEVRAAFERWRAEDPAHAEAFDRVEYATAAARSVADHPDIMALRNETLSRVAMRRVAAERARPPRRRPRRFSAAAAVLAGILVGAGALLSYEPGLRYGVYDRAVAVLTGTEIHRTGVGQRLTVTLEDSSTVVLNTDSLVQVDYDEGTRRVSLEHGQALFEVAKEAARPFVVDSNGHRVTALGTSFDVRKSASAFEVTLIEGRLVVERLRPRDEPASEKTSPTAEAPPAPESWVEATRRVPERTRTELAPGQQLVDAGEAVPIVRTADVDRVTSWREGRVIFEDDSLSTVVAEMNRYSRRSIVLGDSEMANLEVSGAFDTGKTSVFVEALTTYFPIRVSEENEDRIVLAWTN